MIIFIYGEDTYRAFAYFEKLKESFIQKYGAGELNIHKYRDEVLDVGSIRQTLYGGGLFHNKNLIVITGLFSSTKNKDVEKEIEENFAIIEKSQDTILILREEGKLKKSTKLIKELKSLKNTKEFPSITGKELISWIQGHAKKHSGNIDRAAASYLADKYGRDLWRLKNEVEKLSSYMDGDMIELEVVKRFTSQTFEENIFALTDAIAAKNLARSIYLLEEQWKNDQSPLAVFGSLIWQFQSIVLIKGGVEKNQDPGNIATEVKLHPFIVRKLYQNAKNFEWNKIKSLYKEIREVDERLKTGQGDQKALLSLLVAKMCA